MYFPNVNGRVEFLPIEWRTKLSLDEQTIRNLTITECQPVRAFLNNTALDIMYYASSIQRMQIMHAFHQEVSRVYAAFRERNPGFVERGGQVSVVAHSLGAVVAFDVLTASTPMHSIMPYIQELQVSLGERIHIG